MLLTHILLAILPALAYSAVLGKCTESECEKQAGIDFTQTPLLTPNNNDTVIDVVFLLDVTMTAYYGYDDMSIFVQTLMSSFTLSQSYARVAIIPVFGSDYGVGIFSAGFTAINSQKTLAAYLSQTKNAYEDFMNLGEYINNAIQTAIMPSFISSANGYRSGINNHLMVYITTETDFSDGPTTKEVLKKNLYGVVTIGYGVYAVKHQDYMERLAGGKDCYFYAPDNSTLQGFVAPLQNLILKARQNGGHYYGN